MYNFDDNDAKKPFHSSGYAEIAHGNSIGSTSSQSFQERSIIDNNRQRVGKYHHSFVARNLNGRSPSGNTDRVTPVVGRYIPLASRQRQLGSQPSTLPPRERFSEPQGRTYNPFA
jgi:hypothetical protein